MNSYIFFTDEGFTFQPTKYEDERDIVENLQLVGIAKGESPEEAFNNLIYNNSWIKQTTFESFYSYPLKDNYQSQKSSHSL
jgi:hypothetical protein